MKTQASFLLLTAAPLGIHGFTSSRPNTAVGNQLTESRSSTSISALPEIIASISQVDLASVQSQVSSAIGQANLSSLQSITSQIPALATTTVAAGAALGVGGFTVGTIVGGGSDERRLKEIETDIEKKKKEAEEMNTLLENSQAENAEVKEEMERTVDRLENEIFEMDNEFEQQTGIMRKNFETTVRSEIDAREETIARNLRYSFDIKLMQQKQEGLMDKLELNNGASQREIELATTRLELEENKESASFLKSSVDEAEEEIKKLRSLSGKKSIFSFDGGVGVRMENANMKKEMTTLKSVLEEKDAKLEEAQAELEELNSRKGFWDIITSLGKKKQETEEGSKETVDTE